VSESLFDAGLQPERTALAWRRTGLAMAGGALVALRVFPGLVGAWAIVPAALAFCVAVAVLVAAHVRYRREHAALTSAATDRIALSGGALPALTAAATLFFALVAAAILLLR
jgi:uncharacterized membrane protein YidH (DUF202 family)